MEINQVKNFLSHNTNIELRPYQLRIISKTLSMFDGNYVNGAGDVLPVARSVMVTSPTGSGKTITALSTAKSLQDRYQYKIGWVAMRRNLLKQAAEENKSKGINADIHFLSMFEKNPPPNLDMLILDESHHQAAQSMTDLYCKVKPKKILGMTATPYRCDRVKLVFDYVVRDAGIHTLIQDGYLSPYHHYTIDEYLPEIIADHYANFSDLWGKTLIFCLRIEDLYKTQLLLQEKGIPSEVVTGYTDRDKQIDDFRAGKVNVMLSCTVLSEGLDVPELKTVFIRPSSKGPTVQMGGRVFRKFKGLPFKQVVQCKDTKYPFMKTATPEQKFVWMDGWQSLTENPLVDVINMNARMAIAHTRIDLPEILTQKKRELPSWEIAY